MKLAAQYSFKNGLDEVKGRYPHLLVEVLDASSGVSYFEQFVWDLKQRGVADIDIPVLILGIDA